MLSGESHAPENQIVFRARKETSCAALTATSHAAYSTRFRYVSGADRQIKLQCETVGVEPGSEVGRRRRHSHRKDLVGFASGLDSVVNDIDCSALQAHSVIYTAGRKSGGKPTFPTCETLLLARLTSP